MKAVIQRVSRARVIVAGEVVASIEKGVLTLLGVASGDTEAALQKLMTKVVELRIFEDDQGKMNCSLKDIAGEHLIVSQFTLQADTASGRRPSFTGAEKPERAKELYDKALILSQHLGVKTQGGVFGGDMQVELTNEGPATFILEAH